MFLQYIAGLLLVIGTGILSSSLALIAWLRRPLPGALPLSLFTLCIAEWLLTYVGELQSTSLSSAIAWSQAEYIGIVGVSLGWLCFALEYTGHTRWLNWRTIVLLGLLPLTTLLLTWTNQWHGLIWRTVALNNDGPFTTLEVTHGAWFWVHTLYSYIYLLTGTVLLVRSRIRAPQIYRGQTIGLLISAAAPWVGNVLYLSGVRPWGQLDLTPIAFTCSCVMISWSLFRFRLLDIVPIARDAVIDTLRDGVIVLDVRTRIVDLNPAAQAIIRRSASEVVGQAANTVLPTWCGQTLDFHHAASAPQEVVVALDGERRFFEQHMAAVEDRYGRVRGWLLVWHDINDRKRAEVALSAAKESAESASRAKSAFLANMSHELRTPLTAILGYGQLLELELEQLSNPTIVADLHAIQSAGKHLLGLINSVLDLSKIEAGRMDLYLDTFDVISLLQEVALATQPLIEQHDNTLQLIYDDHLATMCSDVTKVRQVLFNLLSNAAKFTVSGTITLRVTTGQRPPTDAVPMDPAAIADPRASVIVFEVSDTGVGIELDAQAHIFQPFTQMNDLDHYIAGGTGLGLAISSHFCRLLGGEITVMSTPGQGSTFTVWLPMRLNAAEGEQTSRATSAS